ncbi:hypothetical protein M9H77_13076 [Catharanthus roseus]|uniref:Uncharacterized protein n=1 Tax=Catharanthus roseus TaxID=4058 RepID=A0ACC0BJ70_CATRO|nr:hypothetical protein M9H77_13076 [Catharanthus roseus]
MAYTKLARARSNCYKDGGYDGNAYGRSHRRNGHYTHRSQMGNGNFSSRAKTFDHIPYENCCENSPYDVHEGYQGCHDYYDQICGREVNHEGLISENDYPKKLKERLKIFENEKNIEREERMEIKEKERVEKEERIVEKLCILDSNSSLSREIERDEHSKEKENEFEKSMTFLSLVLYVLPSILVAFLVLAMS